MITENNRKIIFNSKNKFVDTTLYIINNEKLN